MQIEFLDTLNGSLKVVNLISEASDISYENISRLFEDVDSVIKTGSLRILINNVGMGQNGKRRLGDISIQEESGLFEEIVHVNCVYPVLLTRVFLQKIKSFEDRIAIINVASCAALTPATPFSSLYAASKSFNRSFSISLSGEMDAKRLLHPERTPPTDVICVNPGFVATNMTKMKESLYCCTSEQHARIVFSKISSSLSIDIIPHWKHSLMWSFLALLEVLIPFEWLLVAVVMPTILKLSGKFRNFQVKQEE
jgi:short-subunit dehydrogenase